MANSATDVHASASAGFTAQEAQQYDRQIRLWGAESQLRMRSSTVLVSGLGALGAEVAKNVVLAGMNVVLQDDATVADRDVGVQYFLKREDIGRNRAEASRDRVQELNPLVTVSARSDALVSLSAPELASFALIIATSLRAEETVTLAQRVRSAGVPIIVGHLHAFQAVVFIDFLRHSYTHEIKERVKDEDVSRWESKQTAFTGLADVLAGPLPVAIQREVRRTLRPVDQQLVLLYAWAGMLTAPDCSVQAATRRAAELATQWKSDVAAVSSESVVRPFVEARGVEVVPVAAVVGGLIANEVVKLISRKDAPLDNVIFFDGMSGLGAAVVHVGSLSQNTLAPSAPGTLVRSAVPFSAMHLALVYADDEGAHGLHSAT